MRKRLWLFLVLILLLAGPFGSWAQAPGAQLTYYAGRDPESAADALAGCGKIG